MSCNLLISLLLPSLSFKGLWSHSQLSLIILFSAGLSCISFSWRGFYTQLSGLKRDWHIPEVLLPVLWQVPSIFPCRLVFLITGSTQYQIKVECLSSIDGTFNNSNIIQFNLFSSALIWSFIFFFVFRILQLHRI